MLFSCSAWLPGPGRRFPAPSQSWAAIVSDNDSTDSALHASLQNDRHELRDIREAYLNGNRGGAKQGPQNSLQPCLSWLSNFARALRAGSKLGSRLLASVINASASAGLPRP